MTSSLPRLAALLLCAVAATAAAQQPPSSPLSPAERLVFDDRQLRNVKPPSALVYRFVRGGSAEPALQDELRLDMQPKASGGCCRVDGRFLSKERAVALPTIDEAGGNPAILFFLEHDVREMQRLTKGQQAHFRRRIRLALADAATLSDTTVRYGGRDLPAREVRVQPYVNDPSRNRFERYAGKEYVFVLAEGVPGGVYALRTRVPGTGDGGAPLIEESITLVEP